MKGPSLKDIIKNNSDKTSHIPNIGLSRLPQRIQKYDPYFQMYGELPSEQYAPFFIGANAGVPINNNSAVSGYYNRLQFPNDDSKNAFGVNYNYVGPKGNRTEFSVGKDMQGQGTVGARFQFDNGGIYLSDRAKATQFGQYKGGGMIEGWLSKYAGGGLTTETTTKNPNPYGLTDPRDLARQMQASSSDTPLISKMKTDAQSALLHSRIKSASHESNVGPARATTAHDEQMRNVRNRTYASQNAPYTNIDEQGNVSRAFPNVSMTGVPDPRSSEERFQKGLSHIAGGLEAAGYLEGLGALGKLGSLGRNVALKNEGLALERQGAKQSGLLGDAKQMLTNPKQYFTKPGKPIISEGPQVFKFDPTAPQDFTDPAFRNIKRIQDFTPEQYQSWKTHTNTRLGNLAERGQLYDKTGLANSEWLNPETVHYHGTVAGRPIVEVKMPDGNSEYFYKSTGWAKKPGAGANSTTEGMWQVYDQHGLNFNPDNDYKATHGWFGKNHDYKNWYGSNTYRNFAGQMDKALAEKFGVPADQVDDAIQFFPNKRGKDLVNTFTPKYAPDFSVENIVHNSKGELVTKQITTPGPRELDWNKIGKTAAGVGATTGLTSLGLGLKRKKEGGDISIPDLEQDDLLKKYEIAGQVTITTTKKPYSVYDRYVMPMNPAGSTGVVNNYAATTVRELEKERPQVDQYMNKYGVGYGDATKAVRINSNPNLKSNQRTQVAKGSVVETPQQKLAKQQFVNNNSNYAKLDASGNIIQKDPYYSVTGVPDPYAKNAIAQRGIKTASGIGLGVAGTALTAGALPEIAAASGVVLNAPIVGGATLGHGISAYSAYEGVKNIPHAINSYKEFAKDPSINTFGNAALQTGIEGLSFLPAWSHAKGLLGAEELAFRESLQGVASHTAKENILHEGSGIFENAHTNTIPQTHTPSLTQNWNNGHPAFPVQMNTSQKKYGGSTGKWLNKYAPGGVTTETTLPPYNYLEDGESTGTTLHRNFQLNKNLEDTRDREAKRDAEDAKKFMMDYYNSPMFKQLYGNSVAADKKMGLKPKPLHKNLNDIQFSRAPIFDNDPSVGAISYFKNGVPHIDVKNSELFRPYNDLDIHEVSHQLDYNGKAIPQTDINLMKKYQKIVPISSYEELPFWKQLYTTPQERSEQVKNNLEFKNYVADNTEVLARLRTGKYLAKKEGIYDPFTEKINMDQYKKLKKVMGSDGYNPIDQLEDIYTPEQIIDMMNKIAKNKNTKNSDVAKYGGTTKGWMDKHI